MSLMSMGKAPGPSAESIELERMALEREKQLRVENAKEKTKTFSDNVAFRKKLRGVFALLSGGFSGFPSALGVSTSRGGGGGGGSQAGAAVSARNSGRSSLGNPGGRAANASSPAAATINRRAPSSTGGTTISGGGNNQRGARRSFKSNPRVAGR
jgi:hypothetical protein